MKSLVKVLFSLLLISPLLSLARVVVKPAPNVKVNVKPRALPANLQSKENCKGDCLNMAQSILPAKALDSINQTPYDYQPAGNLLKDLPNISNNLSLSGMESSLASITKAIEKSAKDQWPAEAKNNLSKFIEGLGDGISRAEAEKLKEVNKNCRS